MTISVRIRVASLTIQLQKCHCQIIVILKEFVLIMNLFGHVNSTVHQRYQNPKPCRAVSKGLTDRY